MSEHLRIEQHGPVRVLTIERPEYKNALHGPLRTALRAAMAAANIDDDVAEPLGRRCVRARVMRIVALAPMLSTVRITVRSYARTARSR